MSNDSLAFNGIDARTGEYLLALPASDLVRLACGQPVDDSVRADLRAKKAATDDHLGVKEGIDAANIAQAGWAVIFPAATGAKALAEQGAIVDALGPLLRHRQAQATRISDRYYREYRGADGYRKGESKPQFLARLGAGPGPADPEKVPYYLFIVGDPAAIPYRVQFQLGVQYAVGRIHFDTIEDYAWYARSVVAAEAGVSLAPRATFFGVANPDDAATLASAKHLVTPLADRLRSDARFADWKLTAQTGDVATRAALDTLINAGDAPALIFAASHGMGFPKGDPLQLSHQGALLCQDWPGPKAWRGKAIPEEFYFAGSDVSASADLQGSIAFMFACYGAGTPEMDEFAQASFKERAAIAPHAFAASLPKALLNRPKGGALAVIGHVERAWGHSFMSQVAGGNVSDVGVFESTLRSIMSGMPLGAAMEYFDQRYAELSSDLSVLLEDADNGLAVDEYEIARMWTANNDARGYAIFGDPAVRISVVGRGQVANRPSLPAVVARATVVAADDAESERAPAESSSRVEPGAPAAFPPTPPGAEAESFGLFGRLLGREEAAAKPGEPSAFQTFVRRLGETLTAAADNATSLEVSTWVADDVTKTTIEDGKVSGAELRAHSRLKLDGDTTTTLKAPPPGTTEDPAVWQMHAQMVSQAQQARFELMKTLISLAESLTGLAK